MRGRYRGGEFRKREARELAKLLCGDSDKRDKRAEDDDGLKTERDDNDPFQQVCFCPGDSGFQFGFQFGDFRPHRRQIGLRGEIAVARFTQGLGQGFGLFGRKMPLVPEGAGEPERIEQKRVHGGNMRPRAAKVQLGAFVPARNRSDTDRPLTPPIGSRCGPRRRQ